jgi:hypothetical protein
MESEPSTTLLLITTGHMIETMELESPAEERLAQYLELTTADAFKLAFEQWYEFRCEVRQCQDTMSRAKHLIFNCLYHLVIFYKLDPDPYFKTRKRCSYFELLYEATEFWTIQKEPDERQVAVKLPFIQGLQLTAKEPALRVATVALAPLFEADTLPR